MEARWNEYRTDESTAVWHFSLSCPLRSALERGGLQEKTWRNVRKLTSKVGQVEGFLDSWRMSFPVVPPKPGFVLAVLATYHPGLLFFISLDLCPICDPCPSCPTHGLSWHRVVMKATVADSFRTPLAGCGAHAGTWYGSVRYPFWPTPEIARFAIW